MNIEGSIALDVLSVVYVLILIFGFGHKDKTALLNNSYFKIMVQVCLFLFLDIVYLALNGKSGAVAAFCLTAVKSLYFVVNCVIIWLWSRFIGELVYADKYATKRHRIVYNFILALNITLVIVNLFTGIMFEISLQGKFIVGYAAMWTFTLMNYLAAVLIIATVIKNKKKVPESIYWPLLVFPAVTLCAELLQVFFKMFSLACSYSISVLVVFQIAQNNVIYTDELTGLSNRRMLNERLSSWFSEAKGGTVCGIMIDMDGLKNINDTFGHLEGDNALMHMAKIIKSIGRKDIICARYGGDEFVLAWLAAKGNDLSDVKLALEKSREKLNSQWPAQERIDFSMGGFCCSDRDPITTEYFYKRMDEMMYRAKREKKEERSF